MIIKRISCLVDQENKSAFYECQKQWGQPLRQVKGFLGQIGGWSKKEPLTALIYAFWESQTDYLRFMEEAHDKIFVNSGQKSTYNSINVDLFKEKLHISGFEENIVDVLRKCQYVRISLSDVKEDKINHFEEMQKGVWNIGLKKAEGMLGGTFGFSLKKVNQYLVFTGWQNENMHQKYREEIFPELIDTAEPKNDVREINGELFKVEEAWRV